MGRRLDWDKVRREGKHRSGVQAERRFSSGQDRATKGQRKLIRTLARERRVKPRRVGTKRAATTEILRLRAMPRAFGYRWSGRHHDL